MEKPKFLFGDQVVVDSENIGIIVKTWRFYETEEYTYDVYVRMYNGIKTYEENEIERYRVRHKYLNEEEIEYQKGN